MKNIIRIKHFLLIIILIVLVGCQNTSQHKPKDQERDNPDKTAIWTPEQAARHQKILAKLVKLSKGFKNKNILGKSQSTVYAGGSMVGDWSIRGPKNMPGAFKFAEMLDGTDIIYGVSHNHYAGEYNSKSYIFKGTVYNKTTQTGGDDFQLLTENWPNRYQNLFAFKVGQTTRLISHIENGPLYYSDDEGITWTLSTGLPAANTSSAINRQDNHAIYVTDNTSVYVSTNFGVSFTVLKNFGSAGNSFLYTPRFNNQPSASAVYLARDGSFYRLNTNKTDFDIKGTYVAGHGSTKLSVSGDSRLIYVTEDGDYWTTTDEGVNWSQKSPKGSWYGTETQKMDAGMFFAVHPENPSISLGGYSNPIISLDGLSTTKANAGGWGNYQNGNELSAQDYYNRIRFNFHPDFQSNHFFYNSSGDLISVRCSDGGLFISFNEWTSFPASGVSFNNANYANAHYINLNVINTVNPLVYRESVFTGINNDNHINFSTQDQGSQSIIPGTSGTLLDFYQSIGGDGPPLDSYDGINVWKWDREGDKVYAPVKAYSNGTTFLSVGGISSGFNTSATVNFTKDTDNGWVQSYIDHAEPDKRIWMLSKKLDRATVSGNTLVGHTVNVGSNQIAALTQAWNNPDKIFMLQDGKVFISNDRGDNFGTGITTPFSKTAGGWVSGDIGSGIVLPSNDNWILFCGPSTNNIGSILSKDGGNTWIDVTGDFPAGSDAQTGGMVVTPDSKYIFAGTDIGPYFFNIAEEKWYSIAEGIGFFNATDVDYISATKTVRFGTWGSGILDFKIDEAAILGVDDNVLIDNSPKLSIYPNPANNFVNLKLSNYSSSKTTIQIYNLEGKKILDKKHEFQTSLKSVTIDIQSISSGIYIVQMLDSNLKIVANKRLIIE